MAGHQRAVVWAADFELWPVLSERGCDDSPCHASPRAPTSHDCWSAVGLLSHLAVIFRYSCLCFQAVVSASHCVGAADFEFRQVLSKSRASVGVLTRHVTPLSRAPTSLGHWSAVGLLSFLVVIFGHSRLCLWAAVSASRCVRAADFEFRPVPSECGRIDLPCHTSLARPTWSLVVANFSHAVTPRKRKLPRRHIFCSPI